MLSSGELETDRDGASERRAVAPMRRRSMAHGGMKRIAAEPGRDEASLSVACFERG
jgi:hypothetical protein